MKKIIDWGLGILGVLGVFASIIAPEGIWKTIFLIAAVVIIVVIIAKWICKLTKRNHIETYLERPPKSLEDEIKDVEEVWFAWHTGSVKVADGGLFGLHKKFRFILTKPNSQAVEELGKWSNANSENLNKDIIALSKKLVNHKIDIKHFDGFLGCSIVFGNPKNGDGWVRIESYLPIMEPRLRPSIKIFKKHNEKEFNRYYELYNKLWDKSVEYINPS